MDAPDEGVLDVDLIGDEGSEEEGDAPPSSGPASTPTSCASSPRGEEPASPHSGMQQPSFFHQPPYARPFFTSGRRGPGRPRREGPKLVKDGKIVRRYNKAGGVSARGIKKHRGSRDDALDEMLDEDDFMMPVDPPYMPEKWPGKVCALCNLSERSQLGQGEMRQITCKIEEGECIPTTNLSSVSNSGGLTPATAQTPTSTPITPVSLGLASPPPESIDFNQHPLAIPPLSRRQKAFAKCKTPSYNLEHTDELSIIGHIEAQEITNVVLSGYLYLHRSCLEFTPPFQDQVAAGSTEENKEQLEESRIKGIVSTALSRKCAFCLRHGASIPCKMSCSKYFHLPCVLASGGYMDFHTKSSFCKDHLYQVPLSCSVDIDCRTCHTLGDLANLMTCVICGGHYHGTCVGLAQLPGVRAGWSCRSCRVCQVCRGDTSVAGAPGSVVSIDSRAVNCEQCDKMYHAICLRPVMATVPKYGWKCKCCRVCSDCGARSPGAGPSSRWHAHYTVCDSCYQQRNKGSCCPLCRRAYRAAANRDMIRCSTCKRYVHGTCDPEADVMKYKQRKAENAAYNYICLICKTQIPVISKSQSIDDENTATTSQESSFGDENSQQEQDPLAIEPKADVGLGKGKPYTVSAKVAKKKITGYKLKGGFTPAGKQFQKRQRSTLDFGRKRGSKPKMRGVFGVPGLGLQRPQAPDNKTADDDPSVENKLVLCSSKDKFVLTQDLCVMCGAIGTDSEGCLIACAQCGQTYHPYCLNIKVSEVIVTLGWRCLDCTVCEGCGNRGDEALLVLCDDCDTAWHTYCAKPSLHEVPRGSWRCERCRRCLTCGTRETTLWRDNYTECGPCASLVMCCVCSEPYSDGELIIQCEACQRWLHASCDSIRCEADAEKCAKAGYNCSLCRGRDVPPPHLVRAIEPPPTIAPPLPAPRPQPTALSLGLSGEYYMDDVCLSHRGAHHMKMLEAELGIVHTRRKRRFKNDNNEKESGLQGGENEVAPDDSRPDSTAEVKENDPVPNANLKEGTLWNVATNGPAPEGFTLFTTESGATVLRRKRQRNLNKLGIGGFVARGRQPNKAHADDDIQVAPDGAQAKDNSGESPGNKRKPRRKPRSKLMEQFPPYMQEAFFGKDLLEPAKPAVSSTGNPSESPGGSTRPPTPEGYRELRDLKFDENSDSDGEDIMSALATFSDTDAHRDFYITLDTEEMEILQSMKPKEDKEDQFGTDGRLKIKSDNEDGNVSHTEDSTALKNAILGPPADTEQSSHGVDNTLLTPKMETASNETCGSSQASTISPKEDLSLIGFNLEAMVRDSLPDMDSNDVDDLIKGVLTDDSQESQESSVSYVNSVGVPSYSQQRQHLSSPMESYASSFPSDYGNSNSGQSSASPLYSEPSQAAAAGGVTAGGAAPTWNDQGAAPPPSYNQRSADKMRADESLGSAATISAVLYANTNHPEWKTEFPNWVDRCKQILKKWRALPAEQKAPYLQRARDNRSAIRMKKAQQSSSGGAAETTEGVTVAPPAVTSVVTSATVTPSVTSVMTSATGPVRAPNVTVTARGLLEADAHIRVLTPSEIMRTLPCLAHHRTEQERACSQQKSARETEQERAWKHLQQMRQQQAQQQQQIIHDQRVQAAMQRLRAPEPGEVAGTSSPGGVMTEAPRSAFPAQRFPLHYSNTEDVNRQLRDLLQRHTEKSWSPQPGSEEGLSGESQHFRPPLPVGVRPRVPLLPGHRPDQQLLMQQRLISSDSHQHNAAAQQIIDQKQNTAQTHGNTKPETGQEQHGIDEMDMGDMEKLEQEAGTIGEVGDILTGLGAEDDEELLESLTSEIGEQFNILEYADPELASLNDAEHILDGLELADDHMAERHVKREPEEEGDNKNDNKMDTELQKAVKNIEATRCDVKADIEVKTEVQEVKEVLQTSQVRRIFSEGGIQGVITSDQQMSLQATLQAIKSEVKLESEESKNEVWRGVTAAQRSAFTPHTFRQQTFQAIPQRAPQFSGSGPQVISHQVIQRPQIQYSTAQQVHYQGSPAPSGVATNSTSNVASIVNAMNAQVNAALAAGRNIAAGTRLVGADGAVGVVRQDRTVALLSGGSGLGVSAGSRPPPPPPYPGTLRPPPPQQHPPPPPYPQEQPLLLEELLEQEKREQERETSDWSAPGTVAAVAAPPPTPVPVAPSIPLYSGVAPVAPPSPLERPITEADHHAKLLYEQWLKQYHAFASDQLRYYESEVQKLRKIRKSLNSKQRQLRKSGNELMPNDAAELQRVATEQQALQKHLEAARKQARQHTVLIQEYESKHRPQNPQLTQQSVINHQHTSNQTVFSQSPTMSQSSQLQQQSTIARPMQIGLQGTSVQQQIIRTQQTVLNSDGQLTHQRLGVVSPLNAQGRILQSGRTLVIEQTGTPQQQLVRQLSVVQERPQSVGGIVQFGQQQLAGVRTTSLPGNQTARAAGSRPAMSPLHVHSPHSQSPLHSIAPQSPLHGHLTSPMQSPLHSQQSPLHHTSQSPLQCSTQSPLHTQQSPLHSQQSPMHTQQTSTMSQQNSMHSQQSSMHPQHSPMHPQQSPMHPQQSLMHPQHSPMHQPGQISTQQSSVHPQQSPMHSQHSPMHVQQSSMHTQQSPLQSSMSPQHFLQQLQAQRTSPQLPTPSRSPQIYQQSQIQRPVSSHSPQLQNNEYSANRFSRPTSGCSPLPSRFARPPQHQQSMSGMRVGVPFAGRQQTSPLGSPQPMQSPGNPPSEIARQQMLQRQQYSPMGGAPPSPSISRSPHVVRTPTPSASPAASPAPHLDHGGGIHHHTAPAPPTYRYFRPGLFGGAPIWPNKERSHVSKVSILKKTAPRQRYPGKTAAPEEHAPEGNMEGRNFVLFSEGVDYNSISDEPRMSFAKDGDNDDDEEIEEIEHLDDADIVVVEPGAVSPGGRIATEEDFEELIDSGKPEDEGEEESSPREKSIRTETTTKTVAVISLATSKQSSSSNIQQYKLINTSQNTALSRLPVLSASVLSPHSSSKILNEVSQATVASVSIANQMISVPVLKNLSVPISSGAKSQIKKIPLNISNPPMSLNMSSQPLSKPITSVISVISTGVPKTTTINPIISLATSNPSSVSRIPNSMMQHGVKQKILKTIEKPISLSLSNTKLCSLSVTHDATLPANIFQDESASPDSTHPDNIQESRDHNASTMAPHNLSNSQVSSHIDDKSTNPQKDANKDIDIENEISQQTELPHTLCISERTPLLLGKADIKSPDPVPEKIPDNIMEGDDEDKPEDNLQNNILMSYNKHINISEQHLPSHSKSDIRSEENVVKTIKAIANQTKEMVIDSNMRIATEMTQESVQISIPSPTPSQERYLNDITMREHQEAVEANQKHVESFEDMLSMLENMSDEAKQYALKQSNLKLPQSINTIASQETKESHEQPTFARREPDRLAIQSATIPQLSPLSQPAELTSNMANVSAQLRNIMSSLNTTTSKDTQVSHIKKPIDASTPTQVNFENLLPSSKVEVASPRPSPVQRIDKPTSVPVSDSSISIAQMVGSRINRMSPNMSPLNSPMAMQSNLMKSPAQSPRITNQSFASEDPNNTTLASSTIPVPGLSKIQSTPMSSSIIHSSESISTNVTGIQKSQSASTCILGHTLLQSFRQVGSNLPFNSQSISSSQPPALVMTSRPIISNKEPPSSITVRAQHVVNPVMSQMQTKSTGSINVFTSKLLHTQLTSPLKRSKSTDEPKSEISVGHIPPAKRHSVESVIVKSEPMETDELINTTKTNDCNRQIQNTLNNQRNEEAQNVLLKQLLQTSNTSSSATSTISCTPSASYSSAISFTSSNSYSSASSTIFSSCNSSVSTTNTLLPQRTMTIQRAAPALGTIPSLEAQLARPSIPPPTLPLTQEVEISKNSTRHVTVNPPFTQRPIQTSVPQPPMSPVIQSSTQSLIDIRKPPVKFSKEEVPLPEMSPTIKTTQSFPINSDNLSVQQQLPQHQSPLTIKKEVVLPQQSPVHRPFTPMDVKKELLDESSQQSATSGVSTASDQGKLDQPIKEEYPENGSMDSTSEVMAPETPSEAKKRKRREYQQKKRKQMQMNIKSVSENNSSPANTKKKPRKGSRYEEDYDSFIDNLMTQLRILPPMQIQEPSLATNFAVCPVFGSGDLTKLKSKDSDILRGELVGEFGNARIPKISDYYNTKPFGDEEPLPEKPPVSTQRGFYDQEFQPIAFDEDPDEKKLDFICREQDIDIPDSVCSCSSPECLDMESQKKYRGLKVVDDEDEEDENESSLSGKISPTIPVMAPMPIRLKPVPVDELKDEDENCKNINSTDAQLKSKIIHSPNSTETNENVTVTLTLTSGAAEDILGVLKELAGILHIPPPTSYQIVERTATPPSHKLGLYRSKGKDGKEGTPIDIQSILNGAAKFCRHCDVVILDSVVRAKASEFPLLSANKGNAEEILCDSDSELYFCSTQCYERFAWRPTNIILDGKSKAVKDEIKSEAEGNDFETASTESMETDDLDLKPDLKDEKMDLSFMDSLDNDELMKEVGDDVSALDEDLKSESDDKSNQSVEKEKYKGVRYKAWTPGCIGPPIKYKRPTDRELTELVFRTGVAIMPVTNEDLRRCELCGIQGDGVADGVSRLLNCDVDRWVHLNCALWSEGVYETVSGALMNVDAALVAGSNATCAVCKRLGATVRCFKVRCGSVYHLGCAVKDNCVFYKNKTAFCASHAPKNEKDNELTTLSVQRRVFVSRDEQRQVASVMLHSDTNYLIRVGGLIFLSPGHLLPHQLQAFHTPNYIYPVGYKIVRFYWSMKCAKRRARYVCWISELEGRPRFHVRVQDDTMEEMSAPTPRAAWAKVLDAVSALRENITEPALLKLWSNYVTGEDLFGLTESAVVRVLESLPGVETLTDYRFKFGRSALLEGQLAVNPSGCARCEPRARCTWRRSTGTRALVPSHPGAPPSPVPLTFPGFSDAPVCPYSKQFVHTKSSQYKRMKNEWRNNVYLARSKIQGLGLYAARDLEKHTMVIEYIGEVIRSELSELREKKYEAKNRGVYMFRLDERRVLDATLSGGLARYINHSCQPNCVAETIEVDRNLRIIIFAKRRISRGEELAYDYKFDIEDDAHKIMCMCGAPNCKKWMN